GAPCAQDLIIAGLGDNPTYVERAKQDGVDLIGDINSERDKFNLHLVYFNKGGDVIDYLNNGQPRTSLKVAAFEYFGHSNRACFMFNYSNVIDDSDRSLMNETDDL